MTSYGYTFVMNKLFKMMYNKSNETPKMEICDLLKL